MSVEYVIAGLGNPGERYRRTRHNLGFRVVEALARDARWREPTRNRRVARVDLTGHDVLLVEPLSFMNLSGDAVAQALAGEYLTPERLLVVCDDIALPLGTLRLRRGGSDGGHNGLKSVIERLGTADFPRLRMGVGPVPERVDAAEFVLASFLPEEHGVVEEMIGGSGDCVRSWILDGVERAMARFNARREPPA